jgi:DNA-binding Lrp family transcriptional regulator
MTSKKRKNKFTGTIPPDDFLVDCDGLFITNEFLADKSLSLEAKILYLRIKREFDLTENKYVKNLTDKRLSEMTALSPSSIQRKLKELQDSGLISLVSQNKGFDKDENGQPSKIKGIRYIYLDRIKAGMRKRAINKSKRSVDFLYQEFVIRKKMPLKVYLEWMKRVSQEMKELQAQDEAHTHHLGFLIDIDNKTDAEIADYEIANGVPPGTYEKQRSKYDDNDDDGLFEKE